ncbi:uncharacterized protein EV422DRAFT_410427 [Fimicolochytrium jonesii]|uniref:uncharacterized protein n=1 Tax=Fimicolochytrium jonesii TaxID=1396493 RepID=UPI0022FDE7E8|nr:uncharacterized protein EV422DRAFT_410427 [Fimicolochytrium jonesii]KAI8822693.1 hypothetical protein EV422DRAFT_410427 [Fimicolochytrium jonesii]
MTVALKLVLSSYQFKLNFLLLDVQSLVCVVDLEACTAFGLVTRRAFRKSDAQKWFIVSFSLAAMIYTGSKALQYLGMLSRDNNNNWTRAFRVFDGKQTTAGDCWREERPRRDFTTESSSSRSLASETGDSSKLLFVANVRGKSNDSYPRMF